MNCVVGFLSLTIVMDMVLLGAFETYVPIQWSPLNPLFNTSDGNTSAYRINVKLYSKFNIICPNPANNPITIKHPILKDNMYENIWHVDKKSFETCTVNSTNSKNSRVFTCDKPLQLKYHKMVFLPTTNIKGQPEFQRGKEYYFIATSNGTQSSIESTAMGHCHTHNMRFIIYVCKKNESCKEIGPDAQSIINNKEKTTLRTPTSTQANNNPFASGRKADCFISAHETVWLILVCVLGLLVFLLILSHACLSWRRRKSANQGAASHRDEKLANLIL